VLLRFHTAEQKRPCQSPRRPQVVKIPLGRRINCVLREGVADGEGVRGRCLPGGGDWIVVGSDGLVYTTFTGLASIPTDVAARLAAGERARWGEVFMRSMARLETGAAQYARLNSVFAIAIHGLGPSDAATWRVDHHIFEVL
jgi:hypothetical protein